MESKENYDFTVCDGLTHFCELKIVYIKFLDRRATLVTKPKKAGIKVLLEMFDAMAMRIDQGSE